MKIFLKLKFLYDHEHMSKLSCDVFLSIAKKDEKLKSHVKKVNLTCECGDDECDGTECDIPEGYVRSMVFGKSSQPRKEVRPFVAEQPPNARMLN